MQAHFWRDKTKKKGFKITKNTYGKSNIPKTCIKKSNLTTAWIIAIKLLHDFKTRKKQVSLNILDLANIEYTQV